MMQGFSSATVVNDIADESIDSDVTMKEFHQAWLGRLAT